jgi:hypothetical protein
MEGGVKMDAPLFDYTYRLFLNKGFSPDVAPDKMKEVADSLKEIGGVNVNITYQFGFIEQPSELIGYWTSVYDGTQIWDVKVVTQDINAVRGVIGRAFPELKFISEDFEPLMP